MVTPALAPVLAWTILLAPLGSAVLILLLSVQRRALSALLAIGGLVISFGCTVALFSSVLTGTLSLPLETSVAWIAVPHLTVSFGILIDQLSLLMTLVVTGVGSAIFIYSVGYMAKDPGYGRYFGMLSFFAFSMLIIVLATN